MKKIIYSIFSCLLLFNISQAQFTYIPNDFVIKNNNVYAVTIQNSTNKNPKIDFEEFIKDEVSNRETAIFYNYLAQTENIYQEIKGKTLKKNSKRKKLIQLIHEKKNKITSIKLDSTSNLRTSNAIGLQAVIGPAMSNNTFDDETASGLMELGGRISNTRISLSSKSKYKAEKIKDKDEYILIRKKRDRYLYLDFISRGLVSFDSLQKTMTEYISSLDGAPVSTRMNFQWKLKNKYRVQIPTDRKEPNYFVQLYIDGRMVPVTSSSKIEEVGGSFHIIPAFLAAFPSGKIDQIKQEDNLMIQASLNVAYLSGNLRNALSPENRPDGFKGNWLATAEIRIGNFSEKNVMNNWSVFAKYSWQDTIGPNLSFGFSVAPRGEEETKDNK